MTLTCRDKFAGGYIEPPKKSKTKPWKTGLKAFGFVAGFAVTAIFGANLGTYFDYKYNNPASYSQMQNRTKLEFSSAPDLSNPKTRKAVETANVKIVGFQPPSSAMVFLELSGDILTARYVMIWPTNKGVAKHDEEEMTITWKYSEGRFAPEKAQTRYHYKTVEFALNGNDDPVIVIQNPAHTPGIPGPAPRYVDGSFDIIDVFTTFSAEKWAGACVATDLPQKFDGMAVTFNAALTVK
ncbi:Uncharacterised protein [Candidatus Bilamarchaeum dharawalense]|uniref:Uncharacterized protein n=1 Tax=Candidatus Bilamarchaeum dharawalense TaxID=2885759 RepID=A0A5E4LQG4_9ARCH|nr:Uncharacterised protein [Candidatus Bilamarchaeum dharawalense]